MIEAGISVEQGLSFDDVLLIPCSTDVAPSGVDPTTSLAEHLVLRTPIVSSPMDRVTDARMAIAMAREGGLGIIHRNMEVGVQAAEVDRVKRSEHGIISEPISLAPDATIGEAMEVMNRYHISGVPIVDSAHSRRLVGILTNRDIRFEPDPRRKVSELMTSAETRPGGLITAPAGTSLDAAQSILQEHRIEKLPIVDAAEVLLGLITLKDIQKVRQFPNATKDARGRLQCGAAVGPLREPVARTDHLVEAGVDAVVVDAAHGQAKAVLDAVAAIRSRHRDLIIIAGNAATAEATRDLISAGASCIRVGLGAGSICTTRIVSGVGVPQLTAVMECATEAARRGIPTIADGGIRFSGDAVKALAAGAAAVMVGNLLAGTTEAPGEVVLYQGRAYKEYRGMGSEAAMREGSSDRYGIITDTSSKVVPEGVEGRVPYKGDLHDTIHQLVGGIRSGMGYLGAHSLADLRNRARFVRVTNAGLREGHVHDVWITKEPPNYSADPQMRAES
ncbi:MAG: IMP dehydrogenase [Armatimonadetes bacterium]|nr:IMP dehydrogenase [Armatimonadota bacterium]MDE2206995.1 IMP dehydrogenase [Armatimonadota bacterium]